MVTSVILAVSNDISIIQLNIKNNHEIQMVNYNNKARYI